MPGMDGIEAAPAHQDDASLRAARRAVVMRHRATAARRCREEAEAPALDGVLVKPVTPSHAVDTHRERLRSAPTAEAAPIAADGRRESATAVAGARVLLVEDNEINQQIAVELLEGAGAGVDVAGNGREAVEMLDAPQPPPSTSC